MFIAGGAANDAFAAVLARVFMAGTEEGVRVGALLGVRPRFLLRNVRGRALCIWVGMETVVIVLLAERVTR